MTTIDLILSLAARTTGVSSDEVPGLEAKDAGNRFAQLHRRGLLHKVVLGHKSRRFFTTTAARDVWVREHEAKQASARERLKCMPDRVGKAQWGPDDEAVITERTVFTACPNYTPRFQAHTLPFVHNGI